MKDGEVYEYEQEVESDYKQPNDLTVYDDECNEIDIEITTFVNQSN